MKLIPAQSSSSKTPTKKPIPQQLIERVDSGSDEYTYMTASSSHENTSEESNKPAEAAPASQHLKFEST